MYASEVPKYYNPPKEPPHFRNPGIRRAKTRLCPEFDFSIQLSYAPRDLDNKSYKNPKVYDT